MCEYSSVGIYMDLGETLLKNKWCKQEYEGIYVKRKLQGG